MPTQTAAHMIDASCATPPLQVRWSGATDAGAVRKNNEDSFLTLAFDAREVRYLGKLGEASIENQDLVFAVSDGMGGAKSGEFASKIAVEKITRLLPKSFRFSAQGMDAGFADVLPEIFTHIHGEMEKLAQYYPECAGMGATLTLCWITVGRLYFAHVGDSRLYYLPAGEPLRQVTTDDTYPGWLRRHGKISERESRIHPRRNALQQALGGGQQFIDPQLGVIILNPGDRFLLCSDGIVDGLWDSQIEDLMRQPELQAAEFIRESLANGSKDNVTALIGELTHFTPT